MQHKVVKKVCLLGDSSVGKTSLIRKFVFDAFGEVGDDHLEGVEDAHDPGSFSEQKDFVLPLQGKGIIRRNGQAGAASASADSVCSFTFSTIWSMALLSRVSLSRRARAIRWRASMLSEIIPCVFR